MIRDVVIHMQNEQPLKADIEQMPLPSDVTLVCTNFAFLNGKKPHWTDHLDSWFVFPIGSIRFIEVPRSSLGAQEGVIALPSPMIADEHETETDLEPDADLLRRIRDA